MNFVKLMDFLFEENLHETEDMKSIKINFFKANRVKFLDEGDRRVASSADQNMFDFTSHLN